MMARLVALVLLAAPLSWGYALHAAPRSLAASLPASSTQMSVVKGLTLKTKVKRAAMAAKGRHRLCVFKYVRGSGRARMPGGMRVCTVLHFKRGPFVNGVRLFRFASRAAQVEQAHLRTGH